MSGSRARAIAVLLMVASSGCGAPPPVDDGCRCAGAVSGGMLDVACGESACIAGSGYLCTGVNTAVPDPSACAVGEDGGMPGVDGGEDAGVPACMNECLEGDVRCAVGVASTCVRSASTGCLAFTDNRRCSTDVCADERTCASCRNECSSGGETSCEGGVLRTCVMSGEGCLVWDAGASCPSGFCGDARSCGTCTNRCPVAGAGECTSGYQRTCVADALGCLDWGPSSRCPSGFCAGTTSCGSCDNRCPSVGATSCSGGSIQTCMADAFGCRSWSTATACRDGFCADASSCGTCTHQCSTIGATECSGAGVLRTCTTDVNGCRAWSAPSSCPAAFCASATTCGSCTHECAAIGESCVDGDISVCSADANGCRYEIASECGTGCAGALCTACSGHASPVVGSYATGTSYSFSFGSRGQLVGNLLYLPAFNGGLHIVDVSNPAMPTRVAVVPGYARDVRVSGNYAFVAGNDTGLRTIDVSTPSAPIVLATLATGGWPVRLEVVGRYAYVLDGDLRVIDVNDPAAPAIVATHATPGSGDDMVVVGSRVFLLDTVNGVRVVDVTTPSAPALLGAIAQPTGTTFTGLAYTAGHLLVTARSSTTSFSLRSYDVSQPSFPLAHSVSYELGSTVSPHLSVAGTRAYLDASSVVFVYDVSAPSALRLADRIAVEGRQVFNVIEAPDRAHAYALLSDGLRAIDLRLGMRHVANIARTDAHAVAIARGFLLVGARGLHVYDISDPTAPQLVGSRGTAQVNDIFVSGDDVWVASSTAVELLSLDNPGTPALRGTIPIVASGLVVHRGHAYVRSNGDVSVYDVSNLASPIFVKRLYNTTSPGVNSLVADGDHLVVGRTYTVDVWRVSTPASALVAGATTFGGRVTRATTAGAFHVFRQSSGDAFRTVSIADPTAPNVVGSTNDYPAYAMDAQGSFVYASNGTELAIIDVSNPAMPRAFDEYSVPGSWTSYEDIVAHGGYLYNVVGGGVAIVRACRDGG